MQVLCTQTIMTLPRFMFTQEYKSTQDGEYSSVLMVIWGGGGGGGGGGKEAIHVLDKRSGKETTRHHTPSLVYSREMWFNFAEYTMSCVCTKYVYSTHLPGRETEVHIQWS